MKGKLLAAVAIASACLVGKLFFFSDDTVYITSGCFSEPIGERGDRPVMSFYGINLPEHFKPYGLKVKSPKTLRKMPRAKRIVLIEISDEDKVKHFKRYPPEKMALILWEPPTVFPQNYNPAYHAYFSKIYTWDDDLVDNEKYFKFYYPVHQYMEKKLTPFKERKLCTFIGRPKSSSHINELYTERKRAIAFFEENAPEEFDFYGQDWKGEYKTYRGFISSKACLDKYKFSICYENICKVKGYITEKIFDSFQYGCIPIYLGAENISAYVPENCFIDKRKFSTYEELYQFLFQMSEEAYESYLANIRLFLDSEVAKRFSAQNVIDCIDHAVGVESKKPL